MTIENLRDFASPRQIEFLDAIEEHKGVRAAARALGIDHAYIVRSLKKLRAFAGQKSRDTHLNGVPDGFKIKGTSTYYDKGGKAVGQWVKTTTDHERQAELMKAAVAAMCQDITPVAAIPAPACVAPDLLNLYVITDYHLGMLAWARETGEPWDLNIAEDTLVQVFSRMLAATPDSGTAVIAQLGDFLHSDGLLPVTPTSGHVLDSDSRFAKVVGVAIRVLRRLVEMALRQHEQVIVLLAEGNHDMASSIWLRAMFAALYENEPRVKVIDHPRPFYALQHGDTMLAFHHGHLAKNEALPLLFATDYARMWGDTEFRYAHTGHRHHVDVKEHSGMTVEQHTTLAAKDAYSARGGWRNTRGAEAITYHRQHGEVGRVTVRPQMVAPN